MLPEPERQLEPEGEPSRWPALRQVQAEPAQTETPAPRLGGLRAPVTHAELAVDLLGTTGLLQPARLEAVRGRVARGESLVQALAGEELATAAGLARVYASRHGLPLVDLAAVGVAADACRLVPARVLERVTAIPFALLDGRLQVAIADPGNVHGTDELRLAAPNPIDLAVADRDEIVAELRRVFRAAESLGLAEAGQGPGPAMVEDAAQELLREASAVGDAPIVKLVNTIIAQAAEDGASDVHFEPQDGFMLVRFRVDGVLQEVHRIPQRAAEGAISRLKVLAKLDIAERRKPQDGRISLQATATGRELDLRLATLPTVEGESAVVRLIDKSRKAPTLEELGLSPETRARLAEIIRRPTGALLVTGPTGSGKSTTLYAALTEINQPAINIVTIEDPVEYRLAGVSQVQVNPRAGVTFANALRSILRADPDIVMVGEIRDVETAKLSIEAAMTGHLVLSSMHTTDAPTTITRLNEMGVEPFLTGSAVSAVLAQRLVRKLCTHCREAYAPTELELAAARIPPEAAREGSFFRKRGCPLCNRTGYRGRTGIFQLLTMTEEIERLACARVHREEMEQAARAGGMRPLWADGVDKVLAGITSIEELARVASS